MENMQISFLLLTDWPACIIKTSHAILYHAHDPIHLIIQRMSRLSIHDIYLPFLTHPSKLSLVSANLSSTMPTVMPACALPVSTNLPTLSLTLKCASATTGNLSSYRHAKSPTFRIVMGSTACAAVSPTTAGTEARSTMFLLRVMMLPAIEATRTYRVPGKSFSALSFGGARERRVDVKECSRRSDSVRRASREASARTACECRARRATRIWVARRSVGVGR